MSEIIVKVGHVRAAMFCTRGMREWLVQHGFDVTDFVKNGMPVEKWEATGDALALRVSAIARKEAEENGQR